MFRVRCLLCDCESMSHYGEIHRSIAPCAGAGGLLISPPPSDTCFLILDSAVSCRVPISGHLAEQPTSSKWPRNLGGKHQPRRQSLAKSWLKPQNFRGWGDSGAMNFLQCGQCDQETRPESESGASRSRSGGNVKRGRGKLRQSHQELLLWWNYWSDAVTEQSIHWIGLIKCDQREFRENWNWV